MTEEQRNDFFYVCALIEFIARRTKNRRGAVVNALGKKGVHKQLYAAPVNHCLSFEQVSDEIIRDYKIPDGDFETVKNCKYTLPGFQDIGKLYCIMIEDLAVPGTEEETLIKLFNSFISDQISNFNTDLYYQNPSYLEESYKAGRLLE